MRLLLLSLATTLQAQFPHCPATFAQRQDFAVCYDTANRRPLWTAHEIKPSTTSSRRKHWRKDHELNSQPAAAFTNSGYHRGHLAPAADIPESDDSFLTSNAIAQNAQLNAGAWRSLENQIRKKGPAHVITGAIYNGCGNEQIEAPCEIYKVARHHDGAITAALLPNAPAKLQFTTLEAVERHTGLRFFSDPLPSPTAPAPPAQP